MVGVLQTVAGFFELEVKDLIPVGLLLVVGVPVFAGILFLYGLGGFLF